MEVPSGWLQIIRGPTAVSTVAPDEAFGQVQPCSRCVARSRTSNHATGEWSTVPKTDTGVESHCCSSQDCPRGCEGGGVVEEGSCCSVAKKRVAGADEKIRQAAEVLRQAEEKVADIQAIAEAEAQVERLRVQLVQPVTPPTVVRGQDMEAEVARLRTQVVQLQAQAQNAAVKRRSVGSSGGDIPIMPNHVPGELSAWMEDQHADLLVAMNGGDLSRVQELSTMISAGLDV